jgi:hypothetical protein
MKNAGESMPAEEVSGFLLFILTDAADVAHLLVCFVFISVFCGIHDILRCKTLYVL